MDHQDIRHRLSEYLDDAVTGDERAEIDAHLSACTECSEALRELRKTIEHLHAVEEIEPPAWMSQKIMTRVREESARMARRRSFFGRFVMLRPIQVLALLALTVTAYYIYLDLGPAGGPVGPPFQAAKQKAPAPETQDKQEERVSGTTPAAPRVGPGRASGNAAPAPRKDLPRSLSYRSLDMKYSYEQPPPPEPAAPSEADATRSLLEKKEAAPSAAGAVAPQAAAPLAERSRERAVRSEAAGPSAPKALSAGIVRLSIAVDSLPEAAARTAQAVADAGGKILPTDAKASKNTVRAEFATSALPKLMRSLQRIGTVSPPEPSGMADQDRSVVEIHLEPRHQEPAAP